jgi:Cytochrome c553
MALAVTCLPSGALAASGINPLVNGHASAGAKLATTCYACHGPQGNGAVNPAWPKLAGQGAPYLVEQLAAFKSGQRRNAVMQAQAARLDPQQMRDLAVWFASRPPVIGTADPLLVPPARKVYMTGDAAAKVPACAACHGPSGEGNPAAGIPALSGQNAPYIEAQLRAYRSGERKGGRHGQMMREAAAGLDDRQIAALASYVAGLH